MDGQTSLKRCEDAKEQRRGKGLFKRETDSARVSVFGSGEKGADYG